MVETRVQVFADLIMITVESGCKYNRRKVLHCAKRVVLQARLSLPPHESLARETTERGEDGK